jgi:carbon starvation protein
MNASLILIISIIVLIIGYLFYGKYLVTKYEIDPKRPTPAHTMRDDVDYVPAKMPVLLGHHFASIAGASPIVGPIIAIVFGWVPALLWLLIGGVFMGAVHDFSSLIASIRHEGRSIGELIEEQIGNTGKRFFLIFSLATLVLIVAVFTDIVAKTFVKTPATGLSSVLFIFLAILFGLVINRYKAPLATSTVVGIVFLFFAVWVGYMYGEKFALDYTTWVWIILAYIFVAAVTPVWILLQPRDYLSSFLLYTMLLSGIVGIFFISPDMKIPAFGGFETDLGLMFPILFVTIACGAISGFHSLVASGTTAKQLDNEIDARPVAYGGMLIETLLAVIALIAVGVLSFADYKEMMQHGPVYIFAASLGGFMQGFGLPFKVGMVFTALSVSAFALTSLDTSTRLARFSFQELFMEKGESKFPLLNNRYLGTAIIVLLGGLLTLSGQFRAIWPVFGSANQMLAALALLAVSLWLANRDKERWFVLFPLYFMLAVTLTALGNLMFENLLVTRNYLLGFIALILFLLSVSLTFMAWKRLKNKRV